MAELEQSLVSRETELREAREAAELSELQLHQGEDELEQYFFKARAGDQLAQAQMEQLQWAQSLMVRLDPDVLPIAPYPRRSRWKCCQSCLPRCQIPACKPRRCSAPMPPACKGRASCWSGPGAPRNSSPPAYQRMGCLIASTGIRFSAIGFRSSRGVLRPRATCLLTSAVCWCSTGALKGTSCHIGHNPCQQNRWRKLKI